MECIVLCIGTFASLLSCFSKEVEKVLGVLITLNAYHIDFLCKLKTCEEYEKIYARSQIPNGSTGLLRIIIYTYQLSI